MKNGQAYIINNGSYPHAMISLAGWDDLDFAVTEKLNPVSQKSNLISAKPTLLKRKSSLLCNYGRKAKQTLQVKNSI